MKTLISATDLLAAMAAAAPPVLLECSFELSAPEAGALAWQKAHLPGAQYMHLDRDLAGATQDASGRFRGRHPLPERDAFARRMGELGITPTTPVVCYDTQGGPYAARAWWTLRWMGHADAAVLDGGVAAWREAGGPMSTEAAPPRVAPPYPTLPPAMPTIEAEALLERLGRFPLIDARGGERFRGEVEPLDKAAGHIPGARNRFFKDNLASDGRFKSAAQLHAEWAQLLAGNDAGQVVQQCGSGVTACHNLLALAHTGLGDSVLYPGSWSEWSADAALPRALG